MAKTEIPRVLLDSSALIAVIKNEPNAEHIDGLLDMLAQGEVQLYESVIVMGEVYKPPDSTSPAERDRHMAKLDQVRSLLQSQQVVQLDVTAPVVRKATEYRLQLAMKLPDALHLATAVLNGCDWLVTFDRDFPEQVDGLKVVRLNYVDEPRDLPWQRPVEATLFDHLGDDNVIPLATERERP
ncbi:type II toxin-antitoxin system VapC family toxin [Luteipulveratus halotolerans]|uniref:PIN domain-containing protein n=1 Tax=Luteipulveratus halotolerans TaxID=1631356 RepID=A0A0L6CHR0_9MICO|nr:PIN domain-containing protein [Luteipulveratus halotolerans]KNX37135.1 hypothetical protein VV01_08235 [Luteipulveratus halotolerans]